VTSRKHRRARQLRRRDRNLTGGWSRRVQHLTRAARRHLHRGSAAAEHLSRDAANCATPCRWWPARGCAPWSNRQLPAAA